MELFSLLAKLTLDSKDFDRSISEAEESVKGLKIEEPVLTLDDEDFQNKIDEANDAEVDDLGNPKLGLNSKDFHDGVKDAEEAGEQLGGSLTDIFEGVRGVLIATGITAAISGITNLIVNAVNKTTELADTIDKQSTTLGISKQKYQEWDHALKQSGGSVSELSRGAIKFRGILDDTNRALAEQNSEFDFANLSTDQRILKMKELEILTDDQANAFRQLGVDMLDTNGKIKTSEQLMEEVLLATSELTGDDQLRVINELFGRNVQGITNLVAGGKEQVKELLGEAQELGLVMSDEEIANAVAYGDAMDNLHAELEAIQSAFVADIIPVLKDAVTWLTDFLEKLNPRLQTSSIYSTFKEINEKTVAASMNVDQATATTEDLIEKLQSMGNYWTLDAEGKMTWDALASKALELFPQLSNYIDTDGKKINGNTQEILANVKAWALLEKQRLLSNAMEEKNAAIADQLTKAYEKGAEARAKESEAYGKEVTAIDQVNAVLKNNAELRGAVQGAYGVTSVDVDNAEEILRFIHDKGFETVGMDALDEWAKLKDEATAMREEAEKMKTEANEAKGSLADEQKYLMEEMGFTQEEIDAVTKDLDAYIKKLSEVPHDVYTTFHQEYDSRGYPHSFAIGSDYIPYDNFPALLHRGEQVVTATDARRNNNNVDIAGLEDRIERAIRNGMEGATVRSYLNGKDITDEVNRNTAKQVKARRFA